jgi:hypothetical protein
VLQLQFQAVIAVLLALRLCVHVHLTVSSYLLLPVHATLSHACLTQPSSNSSNDSRSTINDGKSSSDIVSKHHSNSSNHTQCTQDERKLVIVYCTTDTVIVQA